MGREFYFMNKFISKIAVALVGCAMAVGVGVAIGKNSDFKRAEAATVTTWTRVTSVSTLTAGGTFIIGYEATANSGVIVPMANTGSATKDANGFMYSGSTATSGGSGTITMSTLGAGGSKFEVTIGASGVDGAGLSDVFIKVGNNYLGNPSSSGKAKLYEEESAETSLTVSVGNNDVFSFTNASSYVLQYNSSSPRFAFYSGSQKKVVVYQKGTYESSDPNISLSSNTKLIKSGGNDTVTVSYSDLKTTMTASTSDSQIATAAFDEYTYSEDGDVTLTITAGSKAGVATITISSTDAQSKTITVTVYIEREFTKITQAAKIVDGGHVVISAAASKKAMGTQNEGYRNDTSAQYANDYSTITTTNYDIAVLTITCGTGDFAGYYLLFDPAYSTNGGYLEWYNNKLTTYKPNGTPNSDAYYWSISFSDGNAVIKSKSNASIVIRYNSGASRFMGYEGTQSAIALYELTSEIPSDIYFTSISDATCSNVNVGSTVTLTASYLPANATEEITVTKQGQGNATITLVSKSNGTVTYSVSGTTAGALTITLTGAVTTSKTTSVAITVNSYSATHSLVTSSSQIANGTRVVIASTDNQYNYSATAHSNANYLSIIATAFNNDKTTLSQAVSTQEFVTWCVDDINGCYVFAYGGYFLCAPENTNNYLQKTDTLNERCYFTLENSASGVVIKSYYAAIQEWKYQENIVDYTIQFNNTNTRFSLYRSESMSPASVYKSNVAVNTIDGFVDAFMHFGNVSTETTSDTNACRNSESGAKGYYAAAKAAFNSMSDDDRDEFYIYSGVGQKYHDAYERLSWWATANGEELDVSGEHAILKATSNGGIQTIINDGNNSTIIAIVIISTVSALAVGGYFFIRRRKER